MDSYGGTLADIAMYYWKRDLRSDLTNNIRTTSTNPSFWQNMNTFTLSLGPQGTLNPATDLARLTAMAGPNVEFVGPLDPHALRDAYRRARALVLPAEEDFGIAPVESMACGRPVVALGRGGATETVKHGVTGWLVDEATPEAFADAMARVTPDAFDPATLVAHASGFGVARFESAFADIVNSAVTAERQC